MTYFFFLDVRIYDCFFDRGTSLFIDARLNQTITPPPFFFFLLVGISSAIIRT